MTFLVGLAHQTEVMLKQIMARQPNIELINSSRNLELGSVGSRLG